MTKPMTQGVGRCFHSLPDDERAVAGENDEERAGKFVEKLARDAPQDAERHHDWNARAPEGGWRAWDNSRSYPANGKRGEFRRRVNLRDVDRPPFRSSD